MLLFHLKKTFLLPNEEVPIGFASFFEKTFEVRFRSF